MGLSGSDPDGPPGSAVVRVGSDEPLHGGRLDTVDTVSSSDDDRRSYHGSGAEGLAIDQHGPHRGISNFGLTAHDLLTCVPLVRFDREAAPVRGQSQQENEKKSVSLHVCVLLPTAQCEVRAIPPRHGASFVHEGSSLWRNNHQPVESMRYF